jgi:DNA-binding beta-propeller fold protein YncE
MSITRFQAILLVVTLAGFVALSEMRPTGQAPAGNGGEGAAPARGGRGAAAAPLPNGTDPDEIAANLKKLQRGPQLPHKHVANWPQMPKGYNWGEGTGVGIAPNGNVWVANRGAWPIMEFDRSGKMIQAWNTDTLRYTPGVGRGIHGLKPDLKGNIWTTDREGSVIHVYNPEGRLLMILGNRQGNANGNESKTGFDQPTNFWPLPNGNMLISDGYGNGRVVEVTSSGKYVRHIGRRGTGDGEFNTVHGVTADENGRIYIADRGNARIQVFDKDGKFITKWTDLGNPWDIYYVAKEKAIYMADGNVNRIIKVDLNGKVLGETSQFGKAPGELDYAHAIAVSPDGADIYVAEIKNWRIQKWSTRP